jgi:hypothetical protein
MPEPPDFLRLAQNFAEGASAAPDSVDPLVTLLRMIWNARGAADLDLLKRSLVVVEAHAEEYPDARPLAAEIRRYLGDR